MGKITDKFRAWKHKRKSKLPLKERLRWWKENRKIKKEFKRKAAERGEVKKLSEEEIEKISEEQFSKAERDEASFSASEKFSKMKFEKGVKNIENELERLKFAIEKETDPERRELLKKKQRLLTDIAVNLDSSVKKSDEFLRDNL